ncbi:DUF6985 domain-containing protein [Niastella vici]|nr:hypothetical protein [Niastella vici]
MENPADKIPNLSLKKYESGNYEFLTIEGFVVLESWKGFQSRQGDYGSNDGNQESDGTVKLNIGADMGDDDPKVTGDHVNAYNYLTQHQEKIKAALLQGLLKEYKNIQEHYGYAEDDELMPEVDNVSQFTNLIGLSTIHILNISKDDTAYVGYQFGCTWDDEHGLGFMTHKDRIIEVGGADISFMSWVAKRDLNRE